MSFKFSTTVSFQKEVKRLSKKFPSLPYDLKILRDELSEDPYTGESIGKSCYKIRIAIHSKGKGKSGGARVITCVKIVHETVYLLSIFDKTEKENISSRELEELLKQI